MQALGKPRAKVYCFLAGHVLPPIPFVRTSTNAHTTRQGAPHHCCAGALFLHQLHPSLLIVRDGAHSLPAPLGKPRARVRFLRVPTAAIYPVYRY